jgi:hypothetical protein
MFEIKSKKIKKKRIDNNVVNIGIGSVQKISVSDRIGIFVYRSITRWRRGP